MPVPARRWLSAPTSRRDHRSGWSLRRRPTRHPPLRAAITATISRQHTGVMSRIETKQFTPVRWPACLTTIQAQPLTQSKRPAFVQRLGQFVGFGHECRGWPVARPHQRRTHRSHQLADRESPARRSRGQETSTTFGLRLLTAESPGKITRRYEYETDSPTTLACVEP
jgi:hypothetical protein